VAHLYCPFHTSQGISAPPMTIEALWYMTTVLTPITKCYNTPLGTPGALWLTSEALCRDLTSIWHIIFACQTELATRSQCTHASIKSAFLLDPQFLPSHTPVILRLLLAGNSVV